MTDPLFDEWRAYGKIVENDYMSHVAFFARITAEAQRRFGSPIDILDLGCGDASPISVVLEELPVRSYTGVDDSATALACAEENLAAAKIPFILHAGDLLSVMPRLADEFDLIVASYSFHHMASTQAKLELLEACCRLLRSGGSLFIADVFRGEGESRDAYLDRWESNARSRFDALTESEMSTLIRHVRHSDFAEPLSTYQRLGAQAGFAYVGSLAEDGLNRLIVLDS